MQRHESTSENKQIISMPRFVYPKYWKQKFIDIDLL